MKQNTANLSKTRMTKAQKAGLSLQTPSLFTVSGNAYKYYNELPIIQRLKTLKFKNSQFYRLGDRITICINFYKFLPRFALDYSGWRFSNIHKFNY